MILARLLVGNEIHMNRNRLLTIPPEDPTTGLRYDTVTGHTRATKVWIVYENNRASPDYIVRYRVMGDIEEGNVAAPPRQSTSTAVNPGLDVSSGRPDDSTAHDRNIRIGADNDDGRSSQHTDDDASSDDSDSTSSGKDNSSTGTTESDSDDDSGSDTSDDDDDDGDDDSDGDSDDDSVDA